MRARLAALFLCLGVAATDARAIPSPEDHFGHPMGADRELETYDAILDYLRLVAEASPRVAIEPAGTATLGAEMATVVLTSEANQARLGEIREIAAALAAPDRVAGDRLQALLDDGKAIVLFTCTIHATEVGCTQMAAELVWEVATTSDPDKLAWMEDVVALLMPSINPDGQNLVIDWYREHLGTDFEGGRMPWLYHHYVGHDNNRDFYMLTQAETRAVNELLYHRWFPQVFVDEHQMGRTGPRMFVPPQTDPLAPEVHSLIFRMADLIGTNMSYRLEEAGKTGVGHNMIFDSYWPGGTRNTAWWKNVTGLLTEVASVRIATPVYVEPGELVGGGKGFPEYTRRANFPSPWPGGWWRLRDVVEYERIATWAAIETASQYRREILANYYRMGLEAVEAGASGPPYAWIVPPDQHDPVAAGKLVDLLLEHGVRVHTATAPFTVGRETYPAGTHVVPAAQPYRAFLLTMLRPQRYPEVLPYPDGPVIPPYDVTSWSLPISMGVTVEEAATPVEAELAPTESGPVPLPELAPDAAGWLVPHAADTAFTAINRLLGDEAEIYWLAPSGAAEASGHAAGDVWIPAGAATADVVRALAEELRLPVTSLGTPPTGGAWRVRPARVGLYKPWVASMDEGWTRFLLDGYEFPYVNLSNEQIRDGSFADEIDILLLPDVDAEIIAFGEPEDEVEKRFWSPLPEEYAGGLDPEGTEAVAAWVRGGGTVVALDSSGDWVIETLGLPVENVLAEVEADRLYAPGTMLRLLVDTDHPLAYGMRPEEAGYFASSPAFRTEIPDATVDRRVVARYPDHREDIPVSGYIEGAELLERRAAAVDLRVGDGRAVLIGFRAQHRAQPLRTFKMLFNALYRLEKMQL